MAKGEIYPNNLAAALEASGKSKSDVARALGTSRQNVQRWASGERKLSVYNAKRIAPILGTTAASLLLHDDAAPSVPLVGRVMAGDDGDYVFGLADDPNEFVEAPDSANDNTVAVEIKGNSLGRAFDGWLLFYDDIRSPVSPNMHGQLCVVQLIDDRTLVKIIQPSRNPGYYHLYSNTSEDPILDAEVVWAALVKDMRRR